MNKQLSAVELAIAVRVAMTKREKLQRLANVIRSGPRVPLVVFSNIEYMPPCEWNHLQHPASAFALAAADPILQDAGLTSSTVGAAQKFFELTRDELHSFSCDCGGQITSADMADRIERLAARA